MFILTTIEDLVQIAPQDFDKPSVQALKDAINTKYANRVIQNVGLCVCMWDILRASEGLIGHGTGLVNVNVQFRMTVFRPFRGEILYGRIKSGDEDGIVIDLDFTLDVFVPFQNLFDNSTFNQAEKVWVWEPPGSSELFLDRGEPVLFRIEQEEWHDQKPTLMLRDGRGDLIEDKRTPWRLIGSMNQSGLGPTLWWTEEDGENGTDAVAAGDDGDADIEDDG